MRSKTFLAFCIVAFLGLAIALTAYGALYSSQTVLSSGKIVAVNVSVYSDSLCTKPLTSFSWGNLTAGDRGNFTLWIKNSGSAKETLSMTTSGWSPTQAQQAMTAGWNLQNTVLNPNQVVQANLTLSVSPSIDSSVTAFSFNTIITGTG
jgi:hypothetical protein